MSSTRTIHMERLTVDLLADHKADLREGVPAETVAANLAADVERIERRHPSLDFGAHIVAMRARSARQASWVGGAA